jgi:pimeloyl-ACP methyl ester carboxylesterase
MTGAPGKAIFTGASGNRLIADVFGESGPTALLLHGGGQTRHAWRKTAERLGEAGWSAYALDQRGHGDSEWVADAAYAFADFAADATAVADALAARSGERPAVVGASLGGIAALLAEGEAEKAGRGSVFSVLVLVDVTPRVNSAGIDKIQGFMRAHGDGFRSVAEAAEAVAAYLPHRPRAALASGAQEKSAALPRRALALALGSAVHRWSAGRRLEAAGFGTGPGCRRPPDRNPGAARSRRRFRSRPRYPCAGFPRARAACRLCRRRRGPPHGRRRQQ